MKEEEKPRGQDLIAQLLGGVEVLSGPLSRRAEAAEDAVLAEELLVWLLLVGFVGIGGWEVGGGRWWKVETERWEMGDGKTH